MASVKAIPSGYHTVTPYLALRGADAAIDFYKRAFGAQEVARMAGPNGKIMHGELKIGDSMIMLGEECPEMGGNRSPLSLGGTPLGLHLYVADVDASFQRAVAAGAQVKMPPTDMFWGDRFSKLVDPFGHEWSLATHKEDVSVEEMKRRSDAFMAQMQSQPATNYANA
jgi:PhnB protein